MSTGSEITDPSANNLSQIWKSALDEYQKVTGKRLETLQTPSSDGCTDPKPEVILDVFRTQAQALSGSPKNDKNLMTSLDHTVRFVSGCSKMFEDSIGMLFPPAKAIFKGIDVLLGAMRDVEASHDELMKLFERIHPFLQRVNIYSETSLTNEFMKFLGKIMAQLLSILALSTKAVTDSRFKQILNKLNGNKEVEGAILRLESLMKEEPSMVGAEILQTAYRAEAGIRDVGNKVEDLRKDISEGVKALQDLQVATPRAIEQNAKVTNDAKDQKKRRKCRTKLKKWLVSPEHSVKHNKARRLRHPETARWLLQDETFQKWKADGSLLWISGNPGSGKSFLCSAIIEDIKSNLARPALIAYYYLDYKVADACDDRGLLSSLLCQIGLDADAECCCGPLYELYKACHEGFNPPNVDVLKQCLKDMLELPGQPPIFIVVDGLDEYPSTSGTLYSRENFLDLVGDLVGESHPNLFICVTGRPEYDIKNALHSFKSESAFHHISLHDAPGHMEDINVYIRSFVQNDSEMMKWGEKERKDVIEELSRKAGGMFQWVICQLNVLRSCMFPEDVNCALNELPETLYDLYEEALKRIPKWRKQHARRLFMCLVAAVRPLRVEELAGILAIRFGSDSDPMAVLDLVEDRRLGDPEEAVLSTCTTLITVTEDNGSKVVEFSHLSVREFLISKGLRKSRSKSIRDYYITLHAAHTILAQACLTTLLKLDENVDKTHLARLPLAFYAAQHWVDHAKFNGVSSRPEIESAMERLFDPCRSHLAGWVWIHDVDKGRVRNTVDTLSEHPTSPAATALYYAVLCGFRKLAKHLIKNHGEDVNAKCGHHGTPLHAASYKGHLDAVKLLLDKKADVNATNELKWTPLCSAYNGGHLAVMELLLKRQANPDAKYIPVKWTLISHDASYRGQFKVVELLLQYNAGVNAEDIEDRTPLERASAGGHADIVRLLLKKKPKVDAQSRKRRTPLYQASQNGHLEVVQILLAHHADVHFRGDFDWTPVEAARRNGHDEIARLLERAAEAAAPAVQGRA